MTSIITLPHDDSVLSVSYSMLLPFGHDTRTHKVIASFSLRITIAAPVVSPLVLYVVEGMAYEIPLMKIYTCSNFDPERR